MAHTTVPGAVKKASRESRRRTEKRRWKEEEVEEAERSREVLKTRKKVVTKWERNMFNTPFSTSRSDFLL